MAWIVDIFRKCAEFFTGGQRKMLEQELAIIRADKERISQAAMKMSERADHLNEHYKQIMAESDRFGLNQVKKHFLQLNDDSMRLRDDINANTERLRELSRTMNQPWVAEALDEYEEMLKALTVIQKHHKAVQHMEIKAPAPAQSEPAAGVKKPEAAAGKTEDAPKKAIPTALENIQSQSTVLIQMTDDMYEELLKDQKNRDKPDA